MFPRHSPLNVKVLSLKLSRVILGARRLAMGTRMVEGNVCRCVANAYVSSIALRRRRVTQVGSCSSTINLPSGTCHPALSVPDPYHGARSKVDRGPK